MNYPGQGLSGRYVIVQMDNGNLPLNLREVTAYGIVGAWNVCELQETWTGKNLALNWLEHEYVNMWREKITHLQVTSEMAKLQDLTIMIMKTRSLMSAPINRQIFVPLNREELIKTEQ